MTRVKDWIVGLLRTLLVRAWRRMVGPGEVLLHVQVLARKDANGEVVYQLLDGEGRPATSIAFSGLVTAVADIGANAATMDPDVRRIARRLQSRMHELSRFAIARIGRAA